MLRARRLGMAVTGLFLAGALVPACASDGEDDRGVGFVEPGGDGSSDGASTTTGTRDGSSDPATPDAAIGDASADAGPGPVDASIDVTPGGNPVGFPCTGPSDCQSGECKEVLTGSATSVCVKRCAIQTDCPDNFFCDPATPGAPNGFCVPRSPAHCKTCNSDSECGSLSEVCGTASGDTVKACHVDCTLSGVAACPPDYACQATTIDGKAAKVCRPVGLSCLDALGGFCDRVATPQGCSRSNTAGTCVGQRTCLAASTRYDTCKASAPVCKATCSASDPAGCTTSYCLEATSGPTNCGACGNVCPGYGKTKVNVACDQPTCSFSCQGEAYDVDGNKATGCEVTDPTTGNHTKDTAVFVGEVSCHDGDGTTKVSIKNQYLPSDDAAHETPAVAGFDAATGSAPDWFRIFGTGDTITSLCVNNIDLTLTMTGSVALRGCYHLHVETNKKSFDCDTSSATGACRIDASGSGQYDNDTNIYVQVTKRTGGACAANDAPSYTISGHI